MRAFASSRLGGPNVSFGILKGFADGVIENRTAAMLEPYADAPHRGHLVGEREGIIAAVLEADRQGWQIEVHAIGDRAVRATLDAYGAAGAIRGGRHRHRVEHVESIDKRDIPRFGTLGVIASMQPAHALPDDDLGAVWQSRVGSARSVLGWAWESIRRAGGVVAFGSDWPVVTFDPMPAMYVALTRERPGLGPAGGWNPTERMSIHDILRAYTEHPAFAEFAEDQRGRLEPGLDADLVVWDRDLMEVDAQGLLEARPRFTVFAGRVVYDGEGRPTAPS
jgi:predicted amidohydrolase YtcJ